MRFPTGHEVARLRSSERNFSKIYLGVQKGKERGDWTAGTFMVGQHYQIIAADGYDGVEHLLYFNAVGLAGTDIRPNMTLLVGSAADPSAYGAVRIRAIGLGAGPGAEDGFYLEPNDLTTLGYLAAGDYIWVDGVYRLYRKLPYIDDGTVFEDGNANSAGGGGIPGYGLPFIDGVSGNPDYMDRPVALMGSPRFAWAGENVDFYGWRSYGRGGNTIQNWTWDFDGGVCMGPGIGFPGSPTAPIHVRWNTAGEYIASLVVEDNSGRVQIDDYGVPYDRHRAVRPVLIYDRPGEGDNTPYSNFEVESLTGKYGSGWTARIKVFGTADRSEFPDNALIIIYAEDWYGGAQGSIGGWYGQEGILFVGHIRADSVVVDFEKSTVSFEAQTIEQWMKDIDIWPANCVSTAGAPTRWHEFQAMTVEDVLWYLAEFRSTLKDVTDCFFASDINAEKLLGFVDLTEASLYDQMSEQLGSCFFGKLSASRHGSVHLFKHKNMMDVNERAWWGPPVYSFSKQDWRDEIQIGEERQRDSVAQVDFTGFVYDALGNPLEVYSLAPARQTNFGGIEKVTGILLSGNSIVAGQAENNTLAGLYLAWKNIRFPHIMIPTRTNNRVLEPSELDYFAVVLTAANTERGYVWAGKEFLTTGVSVKIDNENGIIDVDIEGEASTWGPDGVAGPYPPDPLPDDPPADNPPGYWPDWPPGKTPDNPDGDPPPWANGDNGFGSMVAYLGLNSGHVIRGTGLGYALADEVVYHNCGLIPAPTPNIYWMALDEFDLENTAMVATPYRVYKTTNLSDDAPTWTQVYPAAGDWPSGEIWMIRSSPVQQDLWMALGMDNMSIYVWVSVDGGDSWTQRVFTSGDADAANPFLELSVHDSQVAWATWIDNNTDRTQVAATDDRFATQTITLIPITCFDGDPSQGGPRCHHRSFDNDDESARIYGGMYIDDDDVMDYARVYLVPGDCATLYDAPGGEADRVGVRQVGCGVGTRNRWWALAYGDNEDDDWVYGFWVSDGGAWTEQRSWNTSLNGAPFWGMKDGHNYRGDWRWYALTRDGTSYPVTITIDRGESWSPQWGNWPAFISDEGLGDPDPVVICSARLVP